MNVTRIPRFVSTAALGFADPDPARRWPSCTDMVEALAAFKEKRPPIYTGA